MNRCDAIKATRNGAIAALVSAAITITVVVIAISTDAEGRFAIWNDPLNLLDVILILGFAFGMYRKSRIASVLMFVYFIATKIIIAIETNSFTGVGMALVFLYFYGKAIQGSFVYHRIEKEENPDYKVASKWTYIIGGASVLFVVVLIAAALMSTTGVIPSTRVQAGNEINTNDITSLVNHGVIMPEDKIEYFYSQGVTSILESGNVLTSDRVILYLTDENEELQVYEIPINQITDVTIEFQGDSLNDSVYKVSTSDPERWLKLFLSVEQKGDQKLVNALREKMLSIQPFNAR